MYNQGNIRLHVDLFIKWPATVYIEYIPYFF